MTVKWIFIILASITFSLGAQDTIKKSEKDLTFTGTKINPYDEEFDTSGKIHFSGYIDAYFAGYTDSNGVNGYQKFPTISPRSNSFGINILQFSAKYFSSKFRGIGTLFYGDCPLSAWSTKFNFIQEANVGFRIVKNLWFDAGFFRTHIGLESIQPRENITLSFATPTYFEPYYLSGAKLTYTLNSKFTFQINAFNGFNTFIENNCNKAVGFSFAYSKNKNFHLTLNTLVFDESNLYAKIKKPDCYNNLYFVYKTYRFTLGFEFNYGFQKNSKLNDSTKTAQIFSSLIALKYRVNTKWAVYCRGEIYQDDNGIFSGPVLDENHQIRGLDIFGGTFGIEFKPIPNSFFRIEVRELKTEHNEQIFYFHNKPETVRNELLIGLGLWF